MLSVWITSVLCDISDKIVKKYNKFEACTEN